jgi:ribonuclease HII
MSLDYENRYYSDKVVFIAGCDEAGRGPLAGPVVAAAVILPKDYVNERINDSKKLSDKQRRLAYAEIKSNALAIGVAVISPQKIDEVNIYAASRLGMMEALRMMNHPFDFVVTDCMPLPDIHVPVDAIIKGDAKAQCIAAASIIAKVTRDDLMLEIDKEYPQYGFRKHKGYPTKEHLKNIEIYGIIPAIYRLSYKPVQDVLYPKITLL